MEASGRWRPVGVGRLSSVGRVGARDAAPEWRAGTGPRPTARSACRPFVAGDPPSGSTSSAADDVAGCGTSLHDLRTRRLVRGGGRRASAPARARSGHCAGYRGGARGPPRSTGAVEGVLRPGRPPEMAMPAVTIRADGRPRASCPFGVGIFGDNRGCMLDTHAVARLPGARRATTGNRGRDPATQRRSRPDNRSRSLSAMRTRSVRTVVVPPAKTSQA